MMESSLGTMILSSRIEIIVHAVLIVCSRVRKGGRERVR